MGFLFYIQHYNTSESRILYCREYDFFRSMNYFGRKNILPEELDCFFITYVSAAKRLRDF